MSIKIVWFDTETTGLDPVKNDIIQIAGKIIVDREEVDSFNLLCQPHSYEHVDQEALLVNKRTVEEIQSFHGPMDTFRELSRLFDKHVAKFDKQDKLIPAGHNVDFDKRFLAEFWKKCGGKYLFSYLGSASFDTLQLAVMYEMKMNRKIFPSYKLEVVYQKLFGEKFESHDALADIDATIRVAKFLWELIVHEDKDL